MAGPYTPPSAEFYETPEENIRIMSCCYGSGTEATMCVVLDRDGQVLAHLKLSFLLNKSFEFQERRQKDKDKLKEFILQHEPHVIAIGAELEAKKLYEEFYQIADDLLKEKTSKLTQPIHVTYVDMEVPRIYQNSPRGISEFPGIV
jgi:transcription elongation factor SPT6